MRLIILLFVFLTKISFAQSFYIIYDGSANKYTLTETKLSYEPVKKENSSSGTYSGGFATEKNISKNQFDNLMGLISIAFDDKINQINKREMLTGLLIEKCKKKTKRKVILKASATSYKTLENTFRTILDAD